MKQTEIGLMPDDWEVVTIGDEFSIQQGKQVSKKNREGNNQKPFLRTANVFWDGLNLSVLDKMHFNGKEEEKFQLLENDLLVCEGGDIGRTAICDTDLPGIYYQNHLFRLRPKTDTVEPRYFCYWMNCFVQYTEHYGSAGNKTTIPNLSQSRFSSFHFPKPDVSEQQSISHILTLIQSAIQKQAQLIRTTTELKNALMQKLFTEGTKGEAQKQTEIGLVPESWEVVEFEQFCELKRGKDLRKEDFKKGNVPVAGSNGIIGFHNQANYKAPGVTVGRSGSCGSVHYYESDFWAHNTSLAVCDLKENYPRFVYYKLIFLNLRRYASGVSVPTLNRNSFSNILIAVPQIKEQKEIALTIDTIENKIQHHRTKKQTLTALFRSMLHQLMTGQIRVKDMVLNKILKD